MNEVAEGKMLERIVNSMPFSVEWLGTESFSGQCVDVPNFALEKLGLYLFLDENQRAIAIELPWHSHVHFSISQNSQFPMSPRSLSAVLNPVDSSTPGNTAKIIAEVDFRRRFIPWGQCHATSHRINFRDDETKLHVQLYWVIIQLEGDTHPYHLYSIRTLRGFEKAAMLLQTKVDEANPDIFSLRRLMKSNPLVPKKATLPEITNSASIQSTALKMLDEHIKAAKSQLAGIEKDIDVRYLHQYRINLRKLRSILSLFRGVFDRNAVREMKATAKSVMTDTGELRDLDVYLLAKQDYFDRLPESFHPGLKELFVLLERQRAKALKEVQRKLQVGEHQSALDSMLQAVLANKLGLGKHGKKKGLDYGHQQILKHYLETCEIAKTLTDESEDDDVHEFRIACKKLRYLCDFFAADKSHEVAQSLVLQLRGLTLSLGEFNDFCVQMEFVSGLENSLNTKTQLTPSVAKAIGGLMLSYEQEKDKARKEALRQVGAFVSPATGRRFKEVFEKQKGDRK